MSVTLFEKNCSKTFLSFLLLISVFLIISYPATATTPEIESPGFQKGMCFTTWDKDSMGSTLSDRSLEMLKNMGVEYVQINVTLYQDQVDSTTIKATDLTPSEDSIIHAIRAAHKLGLRVMLKPHIDPIDTRNGSCWRADIGFYDEESWGKWFTEYKRVMNRYAHIAQEQNVEIFCVGTELSFAAQKTDSWKEIIAGIRKIYSGKLTYAANWDDYKNVGFWEDLDYIGIDAYFPLSYKKSATIDDIKEGWKKWKQELEAWHATVQKPIIFTEIGYSSIPTAPAEPWKTPEGGNADVETQANCYAAFFEMVWDSPWLAGVYWWKWSPTTNGGGVNNRQFTPLNKPAAKILEEKYKTTRFANAAPSHGAMEQGLTSDGKLTRNMSGINPVTAGTLSPGLKTQDNVAFREKWENKKNETDKNYGRSR